MAWAVVVVMEMMIVGDSHNAAEEAVAGNITSPANEVLLLQ